MNIIVAPHPDDEMIGCWSVLGSREPTSVFYISPIFKSRRKEALNVKAGGLVKDVTFIALHRLLSHIYKVAAENDRIFAPDFHWELHPLHKEVGSMVHAFCYCEGLRFFSYSTNMNVPYLRELDWLEQRSKQEQLNVYYASQKDLWAFDARYYLFEGICEWNPRV